MSDFRGDAKWTRTSPANLSYLAIPAELPITESELPEGWGILKLHDAGLRLARAPLVRSVSSDQQLDLTLQVAMRRDNATRYARMREFQRTIRADQNENVSRTRVIQAMQAMISIVQGRHGSVVDALGYHGIKHTPEWCMAELLKLWAKVPC